MNNLKRSLTQPLGSVATAAVVFFLVVAIIGFADSAYLTIEHYRGVIPPCTTDGCEQVLTSSYSQVAGIPVALLGAVYYFAMALAAFIYLESKHAAANVQAHHSAILKWALILTVLGLACSVWFVYLQAVVLGAFCQYCLVSAGTSTILFFTGYAILLRSSYANITNTDN